MSIFEGCISYLDAMPLDVMATINAQKNIKGMYSSVLVELLEKNEEADDEDDEDDETKYITFPTFPLHANNVMYKNASAFFCMWCINIELWKPLPERFKGCKEIRHTYNTYFCTSSCALFGILSSNERSEDMAICIAFDTKNATWYDLYEKTNFLIYQSKDHHHTFIEGFDVVGNVIDVITGS